MMHAVPAFTPLRLLTLVLALFFMVDAAQAQQEHREAFNAGLEAARARNNDEAYRQFELAFRGAITAGDNEVATRAGRILSQIDYNRGVAAVRANNNELAAEHFSKGIEHDSTSARNYLGLGRAQRDLGQRAEAAATLVQARLRAQAATQTEVMRDAETSLRAMFIGEVAPLLQGDNVAAARGRQALTILEELGTYIEADAEFMFYRALALGIAGDHADAVEAADAGLEMTTDRERLASLNFAKGEALRRAGNIEAARAAYALVTLGAYRTISQHHVEHMEQR